MLCYGSKWINSGSVIEVQREEKAYFLKALIDGERDRLVLGTDGADRRLAMAD